MTQHQSSLLAVAEEFSKLSDFSNVVFAAKGAYKETFKASTKQGKLVALKLLNPAKCNLARSEREIDAMKRCNSPRIARLYDSGKYLASDGVGYIFSVEEYFDGGTLADKLTSSLSPHVVRHYGKCLGQALQHLASLNLVHRDIKPDNIMFRSGSDDPILVDFGIVRDLSESSLTQTWLPHGPGTPYFSAPEQLNNQKHLIDWRTDQFSLGVVLGICLTGQHPYHQQNPGDTVAAVAQRRSCVNQFQTEAARHNLSNLVKMVQPWSVHRFQTPSDLLESFRTV
jgi:serine/threonine protein kinase